MKLFDILKRNRKLHYFLKAYKHRNDKEYMDFFLDREINPFLLEFESRGKNFADKRFYIIREMGRGFGFFAEFFSVLEKLIFADMFAFTPIVEWGRHFQYIEQEGANGTENGFEYYFSQPAGYSEKDAEDALFVTISKSAQSAWVERYLKREYGYDLSPPIEKKLAEIYGKYIRLNDIAGRMIERDIAGMLQGKKTIGIHYRGTDFKINYDGHPVCVTLEQEFMAVREALRTESFEQIFLATDEIESVEKFKGEFGNRVVYYQDVFRSSTDVSVAFSKSGREKHHYWLGYEVLRDMYTLSACDGLVAGLSQVSNCARIVKRAKEEKYKYLNIIDNGKNHNHKKFILS